jgi:hypothetical protein
MHFFSFVPHNSAIVLDCSFAFQQNVIRQAESRAAEINNQFLKVAMVIFRRGHAQKNLRKGRNFDSAASSI